MKESKDQYFVAVKLFLLDEQGKLLITKDRFGDWDIPGGRLREEDFETSLPDVAERKVREELGDKFAYELGEPAIFMRHERNEILPDGTRAPRRIFAIGYKSTVTNPEITAGKNHLEHRWVSAEDFTPADYFEGGWLKGVEEFKQRFMSKL